MGNSTRFRNSVGPSIRRVRNRLKLTQSQLAARLQVAGLDLDRAGVGKVESQLRSVFDFELIVLARCLKVPIEELLPNKEELDAWLPDLKEGERAK